MADKITPLSQSADKRHYGQFPYMDNKPHYYIPDWERRTDAALAWLRRSFEVTGRQGSAHSYSPFWGWAKAYPETTGYLIPTLLQYARLSRDPGGTKHDDSLRQLALDAANWLCTVQLPDGAFPGGMAGQTAPSVFNTSQILFGFAKLDAEILAEENASKESWRASMIRSSRWLLDRVEPDGAWRQAAYVPGFVPAYYTRAVWGLLNANGRLQWPEIADKMRTALRFYARRFRPDGTVADWGFRPGTRGFTHTIAYTLEGFLESALLLDEPEILGQTIRSAGSLLAIQAKARRTAGRYGLGWQGDYSFRCPTGNAQLSLLFNRIWEVSGEEKFRQAAFDSLIEILDFQDISDNPDTAGALPGSVPVWGPYLRFRYPNWGVKFFLDALLHYSNRVPI